MEDEKLLPDSSSGDSGLTADDLDFGAYNEKYTAERLGRPVEDKPKAEAQEPTKPAPTADANKGEAPVTERAEQPKPAEKYLTAADVDRIVAERLKAAQPKQTGEDPEPKFSDAKYDGVDAVDNWAKDKAAWDKRQEAAANEVTQAEQQAMNQRKTAWEARESAYSEKLKAQGKDYAAVKAKANTMPFHEGALTQILHSSVGPEMVEYFTRNEQEWSDVIAMQPEDMRLELRIIEREIKRGQTAAPPVSQERQTVSRAKAPPKMLGGNGTPTPDPRDTDNSTPDDETGFAAYNREFINERKRNTAGQFVGGR